MLHVTSNEDKRAKDYGASVGARTRLPDPVDTRLNTQNNCINRCFDALFRKLFSALQPDDRSLFVCALPVPRDARPLRATYEAARHQVLPFGGSPRRRPTRYYCL